MDALLTLLLGFLAALLLVGGFMLGRWRRGGGRSARQTSVHSSIQQLKAEAAAARGDEGDAAADKKA